MLLNPSFWLSCGFFGWLARRQSIGILAASGLIGLVLVFTWPDGHFSDSSGDDKYVRSFGEVSRTVPNRIQDASAKLRTVTADQVVANGLGLSDYQKKWNDCLILTSDDNSKFFNQVGLATAMAIKGYSREAISQICDAYGPGKRRCELIKTVFRSAKDLDKMGPIYKSLEYVDEMNAACEGIGWQLSLSVTPDKIDRKKFSFLDDRLDTMLAIFAERYVIQHSNGNSEEVSKAFGDAFDLPLSKESGRSTLLKLYEFVPFESWDKLCGGGIELSATERQGVMERMFSVDPLKAIEKICMANGVEADFTGAFKEWLEIDAAKPIEWFQINSKRLTSSQKDYAIGGIAEFSASHGDAATARKWAALIQDPEARQVIQDRIDKGTENKRN